jgi:hypothetical protein
MDLGLRALFAAIPALSVVACGGSQPAPGPASSARRPTAAAPARAIPGHLLRSDVDRALGQGPPWLLRRVLTEEVLRDGKFVGWRIVAIPEEWGGAGLKPGDVVTKVNGVVVEKPDDLWKVWTLMASAKELRIAYEREGAARELAMPIDGAAGKQGLANPDAPPPPPARKKPKGTIVIEDDDSLGPPPSEE